MYDYTNDYNLRTLILFNNIFLLHFIILYILRYSSHLGNENLLSKFIVDIKP